EFWKINAEGGIRYALRQQRKHDQARHDERAVADAVDLGDPVADGGAKHNKVQRGRDDGGNNALHQRTPCPGHFDGIDGANGVYVHGVLPTSFTKISSSELCLVCKSLKRMPARLRSLNRVAISLL